MTTTKDVMFEGKIEAIEYYDDNNNFLFQALWDERDPHTPENVKAFREWADTMAARLSTTKE